MGYLIAANLKMNKTLRGSLSYIIKLKKLVKDVKDIDIVVCAPFTNFQIGMELKNSNIKLGAQNVFYEEKGAYTGEISALMLKELNVKYCIVGHSERRKYFNETDNIINKKIKILLKHKIKPIFCIGETLAERKKGKTKDIIKKQLNNGLAGIKNTRKFKNKFSGVNKAFPTLLTIKNITIAYEPIWAIGTGKNATPKQAEEVHLFIRKLLLKKYGTHANSIKIIYGGSVNSANISELMKQKNINGALVGSASLDPKEFSKIVNFK